VGNSGGSTVWAGAFDATVSERAKKNIKSRRQRVIKRDESTCQICFKKLSPREITMDHKIPKSRGGANTYENLRVACSPCNNLRGNDDPDWMHGLHSRRRGKSMSKK